MQGGGACCGVSGVYGAGATLRFRDDTPFGLPLQPRFASTTQRPSDFAYSTRFASPLATAPTCLHRTLARFACCYRGTSSLVPTGFLTKTERWGNRHPCFLATPNPRVRNTKDSYDNTPTPQVSPASTTSLSDCLVVCGIISCFSHVVPKKL